MRFEVDELLELPELLGFLELLELLVFLEPLELPVFLEPLKLLEPLVFLEPPKLLEPLVFPELLVFLEPLLVIGSGGSDLAYEKPLHLVALSLSPMNLPTSRRYLASSPETNVIASPVASARPVRPIRWT